MQAEHEAAVTGIGLAPDGLTIAVGTENGAIGCLDVPTHQYRTLLRSHTDTINAVAVDMHRCEDLRVYCHNTCIVDADFFTKHTVSEYFPVCVVHKVHRFCCYIVRSPLASDGLTAYWVEC